MEWFEQQLDVNQWIDVQCAYARNDNKQYCSSTLNQEHFFCYIDALNMPLN